MGRPSFQSDTVITSEHIYTLDMLGIENAYNILRDEKKTDDIRFYCVGYSVKRYYQNDYIISNLEGHKAMSIKAELIATFLPNEVVDGLYAAVERAGLYVANLTLEPIAAINGYLSYFVITKGKFTKFGRENDVLKGKYYRTVPEVSTVEI